MGGEGGGKQRGAATGFAFEEGEVAQGDAVLPEPVGGLSREVSEAGGEGDGSGLGVIEGVGVAGEAEEGVEAGEDGLDGLFAGSFFAHEVGDEGEGVTAALVGVCTEEGGADGFKVHEVRRPF